MGRDLRFDTLRGLFLVCMTVNHLPTEIRAVTDGSLGVFSAAEAFVFLSGLMAGMVYVRRLRIDGPRGLMQACGARARTIYGWHIVSFLAAFVVCQATEHLLGFCSTAVPRLFFQHPALSLGLGACLLYQPGLLDLLPMYCGFVLLVPFVLVELERGHRARVLAASGALWLASQWAPPVDGAPLYPINTGSFNLFAWQLIFVLGIVVGHAHRTGQDLVRRPSRWVVALGLAVVVYGIGLRHPGWPRLWPDSVLGALLNKPALGLLRLADFGCVAYLVAILGARFPWLIRCRPLEFLGRHSLVAVATQSVVITLFLQFPPLFETAADRTLAVAGVVALMFFAASIRQACLCAPDDPAATRASPLPDRSLSSTA